MDKSLIVGTVPARARLRIWKTMQRLNGWWDTVSDTGWQSQTSHIDEVAEFLKQEYGASDLVAYTGDGNERAAVDLETFVQRCYPSQLLDVVEAFHGQLEPEAGRGTFEQEANRILREENLGWRMSAGELFKLDSEFLEAEVLARTEELLQANGYAGALDEFREARNDLTAGETREAIAKAQAAFESTMKTILKVSSGSASQLIRQLGDNGFYDDLPEDTRAAFPEQVLMSLPTLGNKLGRHGQGVDVVDVPRHYAELAVHLAGSYIRYLVERELELRPPPEPPPPGPPSRTDDFPAAALDDDIPF